MKEALQADCTRYAPGIEIISVRVTKPKIPESVRRNFEQMEEERTKVHSLLTPWLLVLLYNSWVRNICLAIQNGLRLFTQLKTDDLFWKVLIAIEKQRVAEKEAETKKIMAISEAEKNANVSKILMEQKLTEKDSARREADIENQMYLDRQKSLADADYYR